MKADSHKKSSFGLKQTTLEKIESVFQQHYAIDAVIIYGSCAKGTYKEHQTHPRHCEERSDAAISRTTPTNKIASLHSQ